MARADRLTRLEHLRDRRRGGRRAHSRRVGSTLVSVGVLCLLLIGGAGVAARGLNAVIASPPSSGPAPRTTTVTFTVRPGDTLTDVSTRLEARHIVANSTLFYWYARLKGLDSSLVPAPYKVHTNSGMDQVVADLSPTASGSAMGGTTGMLGPPIAHVKVTIPEGYRIEEIAERLQKQHVVSAKTFVNEARYGAWSLSYYTFLKGRPRGASLEGYLFPETYYFDVYTDTIKTARQAIGQMLDTFNQRVTPSVRQAFKKEGFSLYQGLTMAALVQREGKAVAELPRIASVYMNRLRPNNGQTVYLDVDAATRYALGYDKVTKSWWGPITAKDYTLKSPYNTFTPPNAVQGLPFGPICNPGVLAIRAAAHPAHTPYFYYLARGDGTHAFARTYPEFLSLEQQLGYSTP